MDPRRRTGLRDLVVFATLLLFFAHAVTGCSMAFVTGPPRGPQPDPPPPLECTTNPTWPIVDAVGGALVTFDTGVQLAVGESNGSVQLPLVVVGLSAMVLLFYFIDDRIRADQLLPRGEEARGGDVTATARRPHACRPARRGVAA